MRAPQSRVKIMFSD